MNPLAEQFSEFFIVSVAQTQRRDPYITVWRAQNAGYAWPLLWAGKYTRALVLSNMSYYNNGETLAVPCAIIEPMAIAPAPKRIDGDAGPVIPNNAANWATIIAHVIAAPRREPRQQYRGAPKGDRK